ncbi:unnamed protein product [Prorocentrum cordatum]|uniref:Nucleotide-diphospho-sugar transferase domain-containing protein n=1 Tax=Prorocentrum cordatum TaxID=2364126 RepID=A0ABN9UWK7_9DINO|nr:unnamed protein product [Polarella glacialis]
MLALLRLATIGSSVTLTLTEHLGLPVVKRPEWQQNVSHVLEVDGVEHPETKTAIVTFAGKRDLSYIDGAVMLGLSIQKYVPGYPMVALVIQDMKLAYQHLLENAGWTLVIVPNWDYEYCGVDCDTTFLGRWHDSFEKINTFRLPFRRVLFLDSDTYVFSSRLTEMITAELPDGHIAMAKDGCKSEYNSGVMFYQPDLEVFKDMLVMVSNRKREKILDQELINSAYENKVVEFPREFNCVDTMGVQPGQKKACDFHCSASVVVAHFTGHPKPTSAKRREARAWEDLQHALKKTGLCCHGETGHKESCRECPALLTVSGSRSLGNPSQDIDGTYVKTNIRPVQFNGGKPIYAIPKRVKEGRPMYLYYSQKNVMWFIGRRYDSNMFTDFVAYAGKEAQCPRDAGAWQFQLNGQMRPHAIATRAAPKPPDAPSDTDRIVWNIETHEWEREEAAQTGQSSFEEDEDSSNAKDEDKEAAEEAEKKRTRLVAEAAQANRFEEERKSKEEERKTAEDAENTRLTEEAAAANRLGDERVTYEAVERKAAEAAEKKRLADQAAEAVEWLDAARKQKQEDERQAAEAAEKLSSQGKVSELSRPATAPALAPARAAMAAMFERLGESPRPSEELDETAAEGDADPEARGGGLGLLVGRAAPPRRCQGAPKSVACTAGILCMALVAIMLMRKPFLAEIVGVASISRATSMAAGTGAGNSTAGSGVGVGNSIIAENTGCINWHSSSLEVEFLSDADSCVDLCRKTPGCLAANYQIDKCDGHRREEWSGVGACYLMNEQCIEGPNDCWNVYTLQSNDVQSNHFGSLITRGAGCSNIEDISRDGPVTEFSYYACQNNCEKDPDCVGVLLKAPGCVADKNEKADDEGQVCQLLYGVCEEDTSPDFACWDVTYQAEETGSSKRRSPSGSSAASSTSAATSTSTATTAVSTTVVTTTVDPSASTGGSQPAGGQDAASDMKYLFFLQQDAEGGATYLQVTNPECFKVGDTIELFHEDNDFAHKYTIAGVGSRLLISPPLTHEYSKGTSVLRIHYQLRVALW